MKRKLLFLFAFAAFNLQLFAQDSPLDFERNRYPDFIGLSIGLNQNFQSGTALPDCPQCEFYKDGKGASFYFSALYEKLITKQINLGVDLGFNFRFIDPRYSIIENDTAIVGARSETVNIKYLYKSEIKQTSFQIAPYIKFTPASPLFLKLGFAGEFAMSSNFVNVKEIAQDSVRLRNGETIKPLKFYVKDPTTGAYLINPKTGEFITSNSVTLQDKEITDLVSFQMYMSLAAGLEFQAQKGWFISIYPQYLLPLSNISNRGDGFKISSLQFILSSRVAF